MLKQTLRWEYVDLLDILCHHSNIQAYKYENYYNMLHSGKKKN